MKFTAEQIAEVINGEVEGDTTATVSHLAKIEKGGEESLTFLSNPKYETHLYNSHPTICIVNKDFKVKKEIETTLIRVENAHQAFSGLLEYYEQLKEQPKEGIEDPSVVHESVEYASGVYIGAFSYIAKNVKLGKNVKIHPQSYVGKNVTIGDNCLIYPGVKIMEDSRIGNNCIVHSNVVIGADGFGYEKDDEGTYKKVPQIGNVIIEDHVEIGAGTTIDRATMGSTILKQGVKLDNQIQIAHNVEIGKNTAIAAQSGIAGSTKVGENNIFGGQMGIAGHLDIGNNIQAQAQSGITRNLKDNAVVQGSPAIAYSNYNKSYVHFKNLPKHIKKLHSIEKKLENNGGKE